MSLTQVAPWAALSALIVAAAAASMLAWRAWDSYRRVDGTRAAATALLDVHRDRLERAAASSNEKVGAVASGGEVLAASIADLRGDVDQLRWLLGEVPEARARLRREVLDTLLPTND